MLIGDCVLKNGKPQIYLFDGGVMGDISTNQSAQTYKYSGKALAAIEKIENLRREREALAEGQDRTYGLDLYDFHARLFNPALPVFDRPDPLAEDFTWLTPYNYCAGDPVNKIDPDGRLNIFINGQHLFSGGSSSYWDGISSRDGYFYLFCII